MYSSVYAESEILLRGSIHKPWAFARPALPQLQKNHRLEAGKYFKLMFFSINKQQQKNKNWNEKDSKRKWMNGTFLNA